MYVAVGPLGSMKNKAFVQILNELYIAGVFNVFQGREPLGDRDMEQGSPDTKLLKQRVHIPFNINRN